MHSSFDLERRLRRRIQLRKRRSWQVLWHREDDRDYHQDYWPVPQAERGHAFLPATDRLIVIKADSSPDPQPGLVNARLWPTVAGRTAVAKRPVAAVPDAPVLREKPIAQPAIIRELKQALTTYEPGASLARSRRNRHASASICATAPRTRLADICNEAPGTYCCVRATLLLPDRYSGASLRPPKINHHATANGPTARETHEAVPDHARRIDDPHRCGDFAAPFLRRIAFLEPFTPGGSAS